MQEHPIPHNILESLITSQFPVFWLGGTFHGTSVGEASHDPSGAWSVQYGNCLQGGEQGCVPPLRIVTSPDNSFLPGGSTRVRRTRIRGVPAVLAQAGHTIALATGPVVVDVYAADARLAAAAARAIVPIAEVTYPGAPLAPPAPNSGFDEKPLHSQVPSPLRALP